MSQSESGFLENWGNFGLKLHLTSIVTLYFMSYFYGSIFTIVSGEE